MTSRRTIGINDKSSNLEINEFVLADKSSVVTSDPISDAHHYTGSCESDDVRLQIGSAYITILQEHEMSAMCTSERFNEDCVNSAVYILCA